MIGILVAAGYLLIGFVISLYMIHTDLKELRKQGRANEIKSYKDVMPFFVTIAVTIVWPIFMIMAAYYHFIKWIVDLL